MRHALRFYDVGSCLPLRFTVKICFELLIFEREGPSQGKEIVVVWEFFPHPHKIFSQHVFPRKGEHPREMVDFLMMFHFHQGFRNDMPVGPPQVPFRIILVALSFEFKLFCHFVDDFVLTV